MQQYPYNSPQIMTDNVFLQYGGQTGSSTSAQRQAAFLIAEQKMTEHLSCFLVPTIITGSLWYRGGNLFETEFGNVQRVFSVTSRTISTINPLVTVMHTGSVMIRDAQHGYLDLTFPSYYLVYHGGSLYDNQVVYESGLATGTSSSPFMLAALTMASQIYLNMWVQDLSNEGVADIGVQSFQNQGYSENRVKLGRTVFGTSAMAQQITNLTKQYRTKSGAVFR